MPETEVKEVIPSLIYKFNDTEFTLKPIDLEMLNQYESVKTHLITYENIYTRGIDLTQCNIYRGRLNDQKLLMESFTPEFKEKNPDEYEAGLKSCNEEMIKIIEEWRTDINGAWNEWCLYQAQLESAKSKAFSSPLIMREFIHSVLEPVENIVKLDWKAPEMKQFVRSVMDGFFILAAKYL